MILTSWLLAAAISTQPIEATVYKDPNCGCCNDWIAHLEKNGFAVKTRNQRRDFGVPSKYASCHTAIVAGYAIEGHVPASDIKRLLEEKPDAIGLAVPNMPIGSPGMDGAAYDGLREPFEVLLVGKDGSARVFGEYK
ncbi:MAG: DUF411 domain-containing protein [Helicobacteraceae bacterium]|jgi:hypothetical protein|nr:DUF411 domain-containing protein [Helicobacteraceae bacterium]